MHIKAYNDVYCIFLHVLAYFLNFWENIMRIFEGFLENISIIFWVF
jgi:hypothetical protein